MLIGFFEWGYHGYTASSILKVLFYTGAEITVFCSEQVEAQLKESCGNKINEKIWWIVKKNQQPLADFLSSHINIINKQALLWFYTVPSDFRHLVKQRFNSPIYLYVDNSNTLFRPIRSIRFTLPWLYLLRQIKRLLWEEILKINFFYRSRWLSSISYFVFAFEPLKKYALEENLCHPEQAFVTPLGYSQTISFYSPKNITFTIPGIVTEHRRNYKMILRIITRLAPILDVSLNFILLGPPFRDGFRIIRHFKSLEYQNIRVITFNRPIPEKEYQYYLKETTCLISPLKIKTTYTLFKEHYGKSKSSGIIRDVLLHTTPVMLPIEFKVEEEIIPIIKFYSSENQLLANIKSLINCIKRGEPWLYEERKKTFNHYRLQPIASCLKTTLKKHLLN